jgi:peptide/nickel transport system permease protein
MTVAVERLSARGRVLLLPRFGGAPILPIAILLVVLVCGISGQSLVLHDPVATNLRIARQPPFLLGGQLDYPLGTDALGRDIFSRLVMGARISLLVGFAVVGIAGTIGLLLALLAGYFGGWVDALIMRCTDATMSIPFLVIAVTLAGILKPSLTNVILILAATGWTGYARVLRSEVLRLRSREFVLLARVAGCGWPRILRVHLVPNIINTFMVIATLQLGLTIIAEASLSYLGLGVPPPTPAWGSMLSEGQNYLASAWWLVTFPGLAITATVLSTNLLGDWLRVRLDPKYRQV